MIDDSDEQEIIDFYESIKHSNINLFRNNNSLNSVTDVINNIMKSVKDNCDFLIKLDTDEFIGHYNSQMNKVSISKEIIRNEFNNLIMNGLKYKVSYALNSIPITINNINHDDPINNIYFNLPHKTQIKTFFNSKTYAYCDLGCHIGSIIEPYDNNNYNETNFILIHYHCQSYKNYISNCQKAIISHGYMNMTDDLDVKISKINHLISIAHIGIASVHKLQIYLKYLTDPDDEKNYYNCFNNCELNTLYKFDKLFNKFNTSNNKCIIITTINKPTTQILHYSLLWDWTLIIVGDLKTDDSFYNKLNCIYLNINKQKELFPTIFDKIPYNSYTRKMFGYLYAIKNNFNIIYDTDDDNKYIYNLDSYNNNFTIINNIDFMGNDKYGLHIDTYDNKTIINNKMNNINCFTVDKMNNCIFYKYINNFIYTSNNNCISGIFRDEKICNSMINEKFVNIYKVFTDKFIWPRGIPPNHKSITENINITENNNNYTCSIIQGLVNNDPDVDAYYRININNGNFIFEKENGYDIILDKYAVCPFNSQNTFWIDSTMFYALYLPVTVTFRYTDILRGFIALYQLWQKNKTIKFTFPTAIQERNIHDLNKDFECEKPMYETAEQVINLLNNNKDASIIDMYEILYKNNIVGFEELDVLNEWLKLIK